MGGRLIRRLLLDTHAWAWSFADAGKLPVSLRTAIRNADVVYVSPVSFYEMGYKHALGKWPEVSPYVKRLEAILVEQGGFDAPFTPEICVTAATLAWDHRDPFDRLLAATAQVQNMVLVTRDPAFATLASLRTCWSKPNYIP